MRLDEIDDNDYHDDQLELDFTRESIEHAHVVDMDHDANEKKDSYGLEPSTISLQNTQELIKQFVSFSNKRTARKLTMADERELTLAAQQGDMQARAQLIECNIRLVIYLAKRYKWAKNLDLADLVAEGNLGLIRSINSFNPALGYRFSTYASWWIKMYIERAIVDNARIVKVPTRMLHEQQRYARATYALESRLHRTPTLQEIADYAKRDSEWVQSMMALEQGNDVSLDNRLSGNDSSYLAALTSDEQHTPENQILLHSLIDFVDQMLRVLPPPQREVIILRFGLMGNTNHTIQETAELLGTTETEIKHNQMLALQKLRRFTSLAELL